MISIQEVMSRNGSSMETIAKDVSTLTGFDIEASAAGGKASGIIQYCHSAVSGEIHQIGSDIDGTYSLTGGHTHFADGTILTDRTFMQYKDSGEDNFSYWRHGVLVTHTGAKFITLAVGFKGYLIYDENGNLDNTETDPRVLIVGAPLVSYIYLNAAKGTVEWLGNERHGIVESGQTHLMKHMDGGFFVVQGLDITGIADNSGVFTGISAGKGGDEDVAMVYQATTTIPKLYREGTEWVIDDDDNKLGKYNGSLECCYNLDTAGTFSLVAIGGSYVIMMWIATNNKIHPIVAIVGQTLHSTRKDARDHADDEFFRINASGFPVQEASRLASMIIHDQASGEIETGVDGEVYVYYKQRNQVKHYV